MRTKIHERRLARTLRNNGYTIPAISAKMGVSKSSVSVWVRGLVPPVHVLKRMEERHVAVLAKASARRRGQTVAKLKDAMRFGQSILSETGLDLTTKRLVCALLYWCEGEKSSNDSVLAFTNSDPALISLFLRMLREGYGVEEKKFRVCVHLHEYHHTERQLQFWHRVTKIPLSQFIKPYRKKHTGRSQKEGYAGCASIRYYDAGTARRIQAVARAVLKTYGPIG